MKRVVMQDGKEVTSLGQFVSGPIEVECFLEESDIPERVDIGNDVFFTRKAFLTMIEALAQEYPIMAMQWVRTVCGCNLPMAARFIRSIKEHQDDIAPEQIEYRVPTINEMKAWFGPSFERGVAYYEDYRVVESHLEGTTIVGKCEGSGTALYSQVIDLGPNGIVSGSCTCPVTYKGHCKHCAALILDFIGHST